jgi:small subunit ribosomal protein S17
MTTMTGKVVAISGTQTIRVKVDSFLIHPKYKKRLARTSDFLVHDEVGAKIDDVVKFTEVRPISKMKKWKVTEIIK